MINYVQHIAIGVRDVDASYKFYRDILGFRIVFFDAKNVMVPDLSIESYSRDKEHQFEIRMFFALHPMGGAGLEFAQFRHVEPVPPVKDVTLGDIGYVELAIRVNRLEEFCSNLQPLGINLLTPILEKNWMDGATRKYTYIRDPDGTLIQLVETPPNGFIDKPCTMGIEHLGLGVPDLESAERFYTDVLGFGQPLHRWDESVHVPNGFTDDRNLLVRNVLIGNKADKKGQSGMINQTNLRLIHTNGSAGANISKDRRWGDIGLLEVAVDTSDIDRAIEELESRTQHSEITRYHIKLGFGSYGYYAFVLDPFGNLVELVDLKKIWYLPANVLSTVMYPIIQAVDRVKELKWNWSRFFSVKV